MKKNTELLDSQKKPGKVFSKQRYKKFNFKKPISILKRYQNTAISKDIPTLFAYLCAIHIVPIHMYLQQRRAIVQG